MYNIANEKKENKFKYVSLYNIEDRRQIKIYLNSTIWKIEDILNIFSLYNIANEKKENKFKYVSLYNIEDRRQIKIYLNGTIWKIEDIFKYFSFGKYRQMRERRHI